MASTAGGASQRLLTMKFMQRAAAANANPTSSNTPATPASDDGHASKRRKISDGSSLRAPVPASYAIDQQAAQAALEDEDRKRQAAMDRMAERLGDSHWVMDTAKLPASHKQAGMPLQIVQVGFSEIDREGGRDEGPGEEKARVFQSYGLKKTQKEKAGYFRRITFELVALTFKCRLARIATLTATATRTVTLTVLIRTLLVKKLMWCPTRASPAEAATEPRGVKRSALCGRLRWKRAERLPHSVERRMSTWSN